MYESFGVINISCTEEKYLQDVTIVPYTRIIYFFITFSQSQKNVGTNRKSQVWFSTQVKSDFA